MRGASGPPMSIEGIDHALRQRMEERDRISGDLLDLDGHPSHELLKGLTPAGETGRRWGIAQARLVTLWWLFDAYRRVLDRAQEVRTAQRPDLPALTALLNGPSVELKPDEVPVEKRSLLRAVGEWITLDVVLARMDEEYREVAATIAAVDEAWNDLLPRLDETDAARRAARGLATGLGVSDHELDRLDRDAARLRASVAADPLGSVSLRGEIAATGAAVAARRAAMEQAGAVRDEYAGRAGRLGERIEQVAAAEDEARRTRDVVLAKIASPTLPRAPQPGGRAARPVRRPRHPRRALAGAGRAPRRPRTRHRGGAGAGARSRRDRRRPDRPP